MELLSKLDERILIELFGLSLFVLGDLPRITTTKTIPVYLFICETSPHNK